MSSSEAKALLMDELSGLNLPFPILNKFEVADYAALIQKISDQFDIIYKVPN